MSFRAAEVNFAEKFNKSYQKFLSRITALHLLRAKINWKVLRSLIIPYCPNLLEESQAKKVNFSTVSIDVKGQSNFEGFALIRAVLF